MGEHSRALDKHHDAIRILVRTVGPQDLLVATALMHAGAANLHLGKLAQAQELHTRSLDIKMRYRQDPRVMTLLAEGFNNMAEVYRQLGQGQEALAKYQVQP